MKKIELMQNNRSNFNNTVITKKPTLEPFRISDNVLKIGKHKGKKLTEVPRAYLEWMVKEVDMDKTRLEILKNILETYNNETYGGNK